MEQTDLIPEPAVRRISWTIDVDEIPMQFEYWPEPSDQLLTSIQQIGIIHQPLVTRVYTGSSKPYFRVIDGKRRIRAAMQLGIKRVDVTILEFPESDRSSEFSLGMHGSRSNNKVGEAVAILNLVKQGKTQSEIVRLTGIAASTVKSRLVLHNLTSNLWQALMDEQISVEVALSCAKLPRDLQDQAYQIFCTAGKLTHVDLKSLRSTRREAALEQIDLPGMARDLTAGVEQSAYLSDHDLGLMLTLATHYLNHASLEDVDTPLYQTADYLRNRLHELGVSNVA